LERRPGQRSTRQRKQIKTKVAKVEAIGICSNRLKRPSRDEKRKNDLLHHVTQKNTPESR
ncbi:MAG TPA: hypothetical protein PKZ53_22960, partial [Acidobacteriota bacterium]|nr:hypothetical protein [Acidobacteriota bacterium]